MMRNEIGMASSQLKSIESKSNQAAVKKTKLSAIVEKIKIN